MLATLLLILAPTGQAGGAPYEPRFSSLVLTQGSRGGIAGPTVHRQVELGYDWNAGDYRLTVYDGLQWESDEGPFSTALLEREGFEAILRVAREGLQTLPPQNDPEGYDVYRLSAGLSLQDGDLAWQNLASGGCTSNPVAEPPTPEQQEQFASVVQAVLDAVAGVELSPGCELDAGFLYRPADDEEARAFLKALEHVLRQPFTALLDRTRVDVLPTQRLYRFRFAWRSLQDLEYRDPDMRRRSSCDVFLERETLAVEGLRSEPFEPSGETLAARRAFLESHPDLPPRLRRLIASGWVGSGMSVEMVEAAWGAPRSRDPLVFERHGQRVQLPFDREGRLRRNAFCGPAWPAPLAAAGGRPALEKGSSVLLRLRARAPR